MTRSATLSAYLLASRLAGPLARPLLHRRLARGKEDPKRLGERRGHAGLMHPGGRLIWLHGASVGEAASALPLIDALQARSDATILLTTGTVTSAQRMAESLPDRALHQFVPVDTRAAVRRFLDHWRPDLAIWIESELWPRLIIETHACGTPMALVNGRLSERSFRRWQKAPRMAAELFGCFSLRRTQDPETQQRLDSMGLESRYAGNLKALVPPPRCNEAEFDRLRDVLRDRPVWLAASTHAGEEEIIGQAQVQMSRSETSPLLIVAPRHPERATEIAARLSGMGLSIARRSTGETPGPDIQVLLADTMGEMGLWYRLAPVTLVAGSLVDKGGHTPFEPMQLGSAIVHGPHVANFAPAYAALASEEAAIEVSDAAAIADQVGRLLNDGTRRYAMLERARRAHGVLKPDLAHPTEDLLALMRGGA